MLSAAVRYSHWITAIVNDIDLGTCPLGIIDHISKHAGPDLEFQRYHEVNPNWRRWSASMHNLLAMFDEAFLDTPITISEKLYRLEEHYQSNTNRTPEPSHNV